MEVSFLNLYHAVFREEEDSRAGRLVRRLVTLLQALGPIIFLTGLVLFVPESPRWLIARGRRDEAHAMLAKHHANGSMDDPLVLKEIEEIEEAIEREKVNKQGFSAFLRTPGNRRRLLIICTVACGSQTNASSTLDQSQWRKARADPSLFPLSQGVSLFSYYLAPVLNTIGVTSAKQQTSINGGLNIFVSLPHDFFWSFFFESRLIHLSTEPRSRSLRRAQLREVRPQTSLAGGDRRHVDRVQLFDRSERRVCQDGIGRPRIRSDRDDLRVLRGIRRCLDSSVLFVRD